MNSLARNIDLHALDGLRSLFLERMPDFGDFSDRVGKYWNHERAYKEQIIDFVHAQLPPSVFEGSLVETAPSIVQATLRTLTGRVKEAGHDSPATQNIVGWRYFEFLRELTPEEKPRFAAAMGDLLYGDGSEPERVGRFTEQVWELYRPDPNNKPYALSRIFPTFFLMFLRPRSNIAVRTDMFVTASKQLLGHSVLEYEPLSASAYEAILTFSEAVFRQLESWAWCPRDMIDVHSFLWIVTRPSSEYTTTHEPT